MQRTKVQGSKGVTVLQSLVSVTGAQLPQVTLKQCLDLDSDLVKQLHSHLSHRVVRPQDVSITENKGYTG